MRSIILSIYFNEKLVGSKTFRGDRIFIGSDRRAQVRISHPSIALLHAVIERKKSIYVVADLESENGISKNGQPTRESVLATGDQIQVGKYKLKVEIDDGRPKVQVVSRSAAPTLESRRVSEKTDLQLPPGVQFAGVRQNPMRARRAMRLPPPIIRSTEQRLHISPRSVQPSLPSVTGRSKVPSSSVQVLVTWGDRVLQMNHYLVGQSAFMGPQQTDDLIVPSPFATTSKAFLQVLASGCQISLPDGATVEIANPQGRLTFEDARAVGKAVRRPTGYILNVAQSDVVSFTFAENFKIFVRYVSPPPRPVTKTWKPFSAEQFVSWMGVFFLVSAFAVWNKRFESNNPLASVDNTPAVAQIVFQKPVDQVRVEDPMLEAEAVDVPEPVARPFEKKSSSRSQTLLNKKNSRIHKNTVISSAAVPMVIQPGIFSTLVEKVAANREIGSISGDGTDPLGVTDKITATIDREGVRVAIEQILDRIKSCYDRALIKRVNLEGQIMVRFLIGPGGVVTSAQTRESTLQHAGVERCVEGQIKQQKFPFPSRGTVAEIDYPFIFKRDEAPIFKSTSVNRIGEQTP